MPGAGDAGDLLISVMWFGRLVRRICMTLEERYGPRRLDAETLNVLERSDFWDLYLDSDSD